MIKEAIKQMEVYPVVGAKAAEFPESLRTLIQGAEGECFRTEAFINSSAASFGEVRDFYERLVVFLTEKRDFAAAEQKFNLLHKLYRLQGNVISDFQSKVISLRLLALLVGERREEYHTLLSSLPAELRASAEVRAVGQFEHFVELGNIKKAFEVAGSLSSSHKILVERLRELQRVE